MLTLIKLFRSLADTSSSLGQIGPGVTHVFVSTVGVRTLVLNYFVESKLLFWPKASI
jgi:hypothetical protein